MVTIEELAGIKLSLEERHKRFQINPTNLNVRQTYLALEEKFKYNLSMFIKHLKRPSETALVVREPERLEISFSDGMPFFVVEGPARINTTSLVGYDVVHVIYKRMAEGDSKNPVRRTRTGNLHYLEKTFPLPPN